MDSKLESSSLIILPLTTAQLGQYLRDQSAYAELLGFPAYVPEAPNADLRNALEKMIRSIEESPQDWPWNTNWAIIAKQERAVVGGIDFHGVPDKDGVAIIGYGLDQAFHHKGIMNQALALMVRWAFSHQGVTALHAETARENLASQHVLQRGGFRPYRQEGAHIWWQLNKPPAVNIGEQR